VQKVQILAQLNALGYRLDPGSLSYVMTAARKRGKLCVYTGPKTGYTATPDGHEALVDIRKRRRVSIAWLRNVRAVITYVKANIGRLVNNMKPAEAGELRKEIKHNEAAVRQLDMLTKTNGLV
jgi:DNA-binding PadR family transcriptional regulator